MNLDNIENILNVTIPDIQPFVTKHPEYVDSLVVVEMTAPSQKNKDKPPTQNSHSSKTVSELRKLIKDKYTGEKIQEFGDIHKMKKSELLHILEQTNTNS
jgi:hypothetical protein